MAINASIYGAPTVVTLAAPTISQVSNAIQAAKPNTLIDITSAGEAGELVLTNVVKADPGVVVRSPPGQLMSVRATNSSNISFYGGTFSAKRISSSLLNSMTFNTCSKINIFGAFLDDADNCLTLDESTDVRVEDSVFANNRKDMMQMVTCSRIAVKRCRGTQSAKGYSTIWFPNGRQPEFAKSDDYAFAQGGQWMDGPHADALQGRIGAFDISLRDNYFIMDGAGLVPFGQPQANTGEVYRRWEAVNNFLQSQQQNLFLIGADMRAVGNTIASLYDYNNNPGGIRIRAGNPVAGGQNRIEAWGNVLQGFCTVAELPSTIPNLNPLAATLAASNSSTSVVLPEAPRGLLLPWIPRPSRPADPTGAKPETVVAPETLWDGVTTASGGVTARNALTPGRTISMTRGQTKTFGYTNIQFEWKFERGGSVIQNTNAYVVKAEDPGLGPITGFVRAITDGGTGDWVAGQPYQPVAT